VGVERAWQLLCGGQTHDKVTVMKTRATSPSRVGSGPASLPFLHLNLQSASGSHEAFNVYNPACCFKPQGGEGGGFCFVLGGAPFHHPAAKKKKNK